MSGSASKIEIRKIPVSNLLVPAESGLYRIVAGPPAPAHKLGYLHMDSDLPPFSLSSQRSPRQTGILNQDTPSQPLSHEVPHFKPGTEVLDPQVAILDNFRPERPEVEISNIPLRGFLFESLETLQNASKAWAQQPHGCPSPVSSYRSMYIPIFFFFYVPVYPNILVPGIVISSAFCRNPYVRHRARCAV